MSGREARIELDDVSATYVAGDTLKGKLVVVAGKDGVPARGLCVVVSGVEKAWFRLSREEVYEMGCEGPLEFGTDGKMLFEDEAQFAKVSVPIDTGDCETLEPGEHSFPLSFEIPSFWRGSWKEVKENCYRAIARYKIVFEHPRLPLSCFKRIRVLAAPPTEATETFAELTPSLGVHATIKYHGSAFVSGDTVSTTLNISSERMIPSKRVLAKITRVLELSVGSTKKVFSTDVSSCEMPGFWPCYLGSRTFSLKLPEDAPAADDTGRLSRSYYLMNVWILPEEDPMFLGTHRFVVMAPQTASRFKSSIIVPQDGEVLKRRRWQADNERETCNGCSVPFSMFLRRHHCRHCGLLFCRYCSSSSSTIVNHQFTKPVRVCEKCLDVAMNGGEVLPAYEGFSPASTPPSRLPTPENANIY